MFGGIVLMFQFICDDGFQMCLRNGLRSELIILNSYSGSICQIGSVFS